MKRYALFIFNAYYEEGGFNDFFVESAENAAELIAPAERIIKKGRRGYVNSQEYAQIVDLETGKIVFSRDRGFDKNPWVDGELED